MCGRPGPSGGSNRLASFWLGAFELAWLELVSLELVLPVLPGLVSPALVPRFVLLELVLLELAWLEPVWLVLVSLEMVSLELILLELDSDSSKRGYVGLVSTWLPKSLWLESLLSEPFFETLSPENPYFSSFSQLSLFEYNQIWLSFLLDAFSTASSSVGGW